jgi:hypothetical protein
VANRYWVGGTSTWDATAGTKWALTSGGAGGQAVPTSADDVFFTAVSGAVTVTVSVAANAKTLDFTGFTGTFTTGFAVSIYGGLTLSSAMTLTINGVFINFLATTDNSGVGWPITTNGKAFTAGSANTYAFAGVGGKWVFQDNITFGNASTLTLQAGALDTNSKTVTVGNLTSSGAGVKSLTLGSSVVNLTLLNTPINMAGTNQTLSAGTSTINITPTANAGNWGTTVGLVWNNIVMAGAGSALLAPLICANFTRTGTALKTDSLGLGGNIICSGTFTCTGNSVINRLSITTSIPGNGFVVIANSHVITNSDLMDISLSSYTLGSVITSDSFNRTNGSLGGSSTDVAAGGTAKVWSSPSSGTWNIASNLVQTQLANVTVNSITVDAGTRNVAVQAKFAALGLSANSSGMIIAAYVDANNFAVCRVTASGVLSAGYVLAGSLSVTNITGVTVVAGDTISMELVGPNIIARVNGTYAGIYNIPTTANAVIQGTRVGLAGTNNNVVINQFDDFKVSNCSPAVTLAGCGDALGNGNIIFPTSLNRYAVAAGNWSSTSMWSATSGGAAGASVPLPQDNVFFNASSAAGTYVIDVPRLGANLDFSGFTGTLTVSATTSQFGSLLLSSTMGYNLSNNFGWTFRGRGSHTITLAGRAWQDGGIGTIISAPNGTYDLLDNWIGGVSFFLNVLQGTFNSNNFTINASALQSIGSSTRLINLGSSTITLTYSTFWTVSGIGYTINASNATIVLNPSTIGFRTFTGGSVTYGTLQYTLVGSFNQLNISGNNYFDTLHIGPQRGLLFTSGSINTVKNWIASGVNNGYQAFGGGQSGVAAGVYIADTPILRVAGDISIVAKLTMPSWANGAYSTIVAKNNVALTAGYVLRIGIAGNLNVFIGNVQINSSVPVTSVFSPGSTGWVRFSWSDSANQATFYTSNDGVSWTQLGTVVALSSVGIPTSTDTLFIGQRNTNDPLFGNMYRLIIYSDITLTTKVIDVDFSTKTLGANTFTESSSNALTVNITDPICRVGDGRVLVSSLTAASPAYLELVGPIDTLNHQTVQDVFSTVPYKYYAGANSVSISGNTNVTISGAPVNIPYINYQTPTNTVATTSTTATFSNSVTATSGSLLVACFIASNNNPGTVTAPVGWTLVDSTNNSSQAYNYIYYKIATGGETAITITMTTNSLTTSLKLFEVAGFSGTASLDVKSKNNGSAVSSTSLSTGPAVSNTIYPGIVFALWGAGNIMGAGASITNGFQESRPLVQDTIARFFVLPLTSAGSLSSTYTWTSLRFATAQMAVFGDVNIAAGHMLSLLGVGS